MIILEIMKKLIRNFVTITYLVSLYNLYLQLIYRFRGIYVIHNKNLYRLIKDKKEIRLSDTHKVYLQDTLDNYDYYFDGVEPAVSKFTQVVDYSKPSWHDVKDFKLMPIFFNSFSEPISTAKQYTDFANLSEESIAIDLGAYSGLTSIFMDQDIIRKNPKNYMGGGVGLVIAVEADSANFLTCKKNFSLYNKITNRNIELINAGAWSHANGIFFSSEGNMGSSAVDIVGLGRGNSEFIKTVTLVDIVEQFKLNRVDFIKVDIEGAEVEVLNNPDFFNKFKPKVVIEPHFVKGVSTENICKKIMESYGYNCQSEKQKNYSLPLLFCYP